MTPEQARALFYEHREPGDLAHYGEKAAVAAILAATQSKAAQDEIGTWQENVEFLLAKCPYTIRGHEGGGAENLIVSLVLTFGKMQHMLAEDCYDAHPNIGFPIALDAE